MASRKKYQWILVCCIVALVVLIFFAPSYGWRVRQWLRPAGGSPGEPTQADNPSFAAQNEILRAELAVLQSVAVEIPQNPNGTIRAMVYLQYPFGFKNELLVNAGSNEGVAVGKAVTFQGIFIGIVAQVFPDTALVQTVFDPGFKMPVRIGGGATAAKPASSDALLVGGANPKAASIAKTAAIAVSDIIYTASPNVPYGLPVGLVNATSASPDGLFQEASISFAYDANEIQTVLVDK